MRIINFQLKDKEYKNLDIDLINNTSGVIAFIGNNGSGKSNILESLSLIFYYLYNKRDKEIPFNFSITYTISGRSIPIQIIKKKSTIICYDGDKMISDPYTFLPKQIVAIYSGEENRLWEKWYKPIYLDYINNITSGKSIGIGSFNELPKMLFINKYYWDISLLCLLLQQYYYSEDTFCKESLNIKNVHSIKFKFNKDNYKNYPTSPVKVFIQLIDSKDEYTLNELIKIIEETSFNISDIYKFLYIAFTPDKKKIIEKITIKYNDENLEVDDFSEGEKKMLLIKAALEFAGTEDSLFILDEPDAHIHLSNKIQITNEFKKYSDNRQVIITTHSPTLTDTLSESSLYMLNNGKLLTQKKQEILNCVASECWNKMQQNAFASSKKPIILLVEGKHDKVHILNAYNALKEEYLDLDFDIFKLNTETNIRPFLRGLYESEFDNSKLYIGLFDREEKILKDLKNSKNYTPVNSTNFFKILESDKPNSNYFVTTLPEIENKKCDCSIEMMYEYAKWEEAYQKAVLNTIGKTTNKSIKNYSDDVLNDAKNILSENSKLFSKLDFTLYRKLFDQLKEIVKFYNDNKILIPEIAPNDINVTNTQTPHPTPIPILIPTPTKKTSAKENHLKYWTSFKEFVERNNVSFKLQSPKKQHWIYISVGSNDFKFSLIANTMKKYLCIQFCFRGENALIHFRKYKSNFEADASIEISPDLEWKENKGKKEHYVNLFLYNNDPFNESDWERQHKILMDFTEIFYRYFKPLVKSNKKIIDKL